MPRCFQDLKIYNDTDQQLVFAYGLAYNPAVWQKSPWTGSPW